MRTTRFLLLLLLILPVAFSRPDGSAIVISEVLYDGKGGFETGLEWIELYNPTNDTINIGSWKIYKKNDVLISTFPSNTFIASNGYLLIGDSQPLPATLPYPDFRGPISILSNTGDVVILKDSLGNVVDSVGWGSVTTGFEGSKYNVHVSDGYSIERKPGNGCGNGLDTDNNSYDFFYQALPNPSNSSKIEDACVVACYTYEDCSDGLVCNGIEICASGFCIKGQPISCTQNDFTLNSCTDPAEGISTTLDTYLFKSTCTEPGICSTVPTSWTDQVNHQCNSDICNAECSSDSDCGSVDCGTLDECIGNDYYQYANTFNNCNSDCGCEAAYCGEPIIIPNDPRCMTCNSNSDCQDGNYCNGVEKCSYGQCKSGISVTCSNGIFCDGDEVCDEQTDSCKATSVRDCSVNDVLAHTTCDGADDGNDLTLDSFQTFDSVCIEENDICSISPLLPLHECSYSCGAGCTKDSDCLTGKCENCQCEGLVDDLEINYLRGNILIDGEKSDNQSYQVEIIEGNFAGYKLIGIASEGYLYTGDDIHFSSGNSYLLSVEICNYTSVFVNGGNTDINISCIVPPVITNLHHNPILPNDEEMVHFYANITDNLAVQSAYLYYSIDGGAYQALSMIGGHASAGPFGNNNLIRYYVSANDSYGSWSQTDIMTFNVTSIDVDKDGYNSSIDCNDNDSSIYPGALELTDDIDQNCNPDISTVVNPFGTIVIQEDDVFSDTMSLSARIVDKDNYTSVHFDMKISEPLDLELIEGAIQISSPADWNGHGNLTLEYNDGIHMTKFVIPIIVQSVNDAPDFSQLISNINAVEGDLISLNSTGKIIASDVEGDSVHIQYSCDKCTFSDDGKWWTNYSSAGSYNVTISASDGTLSSSYEIIVAVAESSQGDVNLDGVVDILDLIIVKQSLGAYGNLRYDTNQDGYIDILDLIVIRNHFS